MTDRALLVVGVSMGALIIALLVVILLSKWYIRGEFVGLMKSFRDESAIHYQETLALLRATRDLAASARNNREETAEAVKGLREVPTREELARKIEEVPERTVQKIAEKLPESR